MSDARRDLDWDAIASNCAIIVSAMSGEPYNLLRYHPYRKEPRVEHDITILRKLIED